MQVGVAKLDLAHLATPNGGVVETFSSLLNPFYQVPRQLWRGPLEERVQQYCGITTRMLELAPAPRVALEKLRGFIGVCHARARACDGLGTRLVFFR